MRVEKKVKITDCSDPFYWYANKIGEVVEVFSEEIDCYWTRADGGYSNFILKGDCMVENAGNNNIVVGFDMAEISMNQLTKEIHQDNVRAGWWTDLESGANLAEEARRGTRFGKALVNEKLALIHRETSAGWEGHRKNLMDDKLPQYPMLGVELADAVIRIFDLAGCMNYDLGTMIQEKRRFNANRADHKIENRKKEGGKSC